jgi:hypothetical protein
MFQQFVSQAFSFWVHTGHLVLLSSSWKLTSYTGICTPSVLRNLKLATTYRGWGGVSGEGRRT